MRKKERKDRERGREEDREMGGWADGIGEADRGSVASHNNKKR